MKFGPQLRRWRRDADLTLADVSKQLKLSIVHISQIEREAKSPPSAELLEQWLRMLSKEDELNNVHSLAARARKSLKITLTGRSNSVVDMAGTLARQVEANQISDDTADQISKLLAELMKD